MLDNLKERSTLKCGAQTSLGRMEQSCKVVGSIILTQELTQERYQFETQWSRDRNANGISTIKCVCHASHVCYVAGVSNLAWMRAEST